MTKQQMLLECLKRARARLRQLGDNALYISEALDAVETKRVSPKAYSLWKAAMEQQYGTMTYNKGVK